MADTRPEPTQAERGCNRVFIALLIIFLLGIAFGLARVLGLV